MIGIPNYGFKERRNFAYIFETQRGSASNLADRFSDGDAGAFFHSRNGASLNRNDFGASLKLGAVGASSKPAPGRFATVPENHCGSKLPWAPV
jgi:hypothetical protein